MLIKPTGYQIVALETGVIKDFFEPSNLFMFESIQLGFLYICNYYKDRLYEEEEDDYYDYILVQCVKCRNKVRHAVIDPIKCFDTIQEAETFAKYYIKNYDVLYTNFAGS